LRGDYINRYTSEEDAYSSLEDAALNSALLVSGGTTREAMADEGDEVVF
jgi:hypothetical protein